jgi:hypothetical protein
MWSYRKVETSKDFQYGILAGPNAWELGVSNGSIDLSKGSDNKLLEVIITRSDDHAATVSLLKFKRPSDGLPIIQVSTEQDIAMKFWLDYEDSFDKAVEEMVEHFEYGKE